MNVVRVKSMTRKDRTHAYQRMKNQRMKWLNARTEEEVKALHLEYKWVTLPWGKPSMPENDLISEGGASYEAGLIDILIWYPGSRATSKLQRNKL